jgi:hypothetical protein
VAVSSQLPGAVESKAYRRRTRSGICGEHVDKQQAAHLCAELGAHAYGKAHHERPRDVDSLVEHPTVAHHTRKVEGYVKRDKCKAAFLNGIPFEVSSVARPKVKPAFDTGKLPVVQSSAPHSDHHTAESLRSTRSAFLDPTDVAR